MKRRTIILILTAIFILAACTSLPDSKTVFSLPVKITANLKGSDACFTAEITEEHCIIRFDENHALAGTELQFGTESGSATVGGYTREVSIDLFPAQKAFIKALRFLNGKDISGAKAEDGVKYTIDEMTIMVYYDKDTERISGIGTEENGRRFDFSIASLEPYEIQSNGAGQD